jgi:hypothetical protein
MHEAAPRQGGRPQRQDSLGLVSGLRRHTTGAGGWARDRKRVQDDKTRHWRTAETTTGQNCLSHMVAALCGIEVTWARGRVCPR